MILLYNVYHDDKGFVGYLEKDLGEFLVVKNPWSKKINTYPADDCWIEKEELEANIKTDNNNQYHAITKY